MRPIEIAPGLIVVSSDEHRFGTDAVLLADFARVKRRDTVCDLGTGCGILPMLLQRRNAPAVIYGVDIQPQAIRQLQMGIEQSTGVVSQIYPVCADLKTLWQDAPMKQCDAVLCNPPYYATPPDGHISQNQAQYIARHEVACTIYDVCAAAKKLLRYGGRLFLCHRAERLADCICAMRTQGIEPKRLRFVAKKPDCAPWLLLLEGQTGAKPFLRVEPMLTTANGIQTSAQYQAGLSS